MNQKKLGLSIFYASIGLVHSIHYCFGMPNPIQPLESEDSVRSQSASPLVLQLKHSPPQTLKRLQSAPALLRGRDVEIEINELLAGMTKASPKPIVLIMEDTNTIRKILENNIKKTKEAFPFAVKDGLAGITAYEKISSLVDHNSDSIENQKSQVFFAIFSDLEMDDPKTGLSINGSEAIARIRKREMREGRPLSPVYVNTNRDPSYSIPLFAAEMKAHLGEAGRLKTSPENDPSDPAALEHLLKVNEYIPSDVIEKLDTLSWEEQRVHLRTLKIEFLREKVVTPEIIKSVLAGTL